MLLVSWALAGASLGATFDVRDHGAKGDGVADDAPAIQHALQAAAQAQGESTVRLRAGRYLLASGVDNGTHFRLRGAQGISIAGEGGVTLVSATLARFCFRFANCQRVTVRGLTITRDRRNFTQGTITAVDPATKSVRLAIADGYDEPDRDGLGQPERLKLFTDPGSKSWGQRWEPRLLNRERVAPRDWRLTLDSLPPVPLVGVQALYWKYAGGWAFEFAECADMLVEDVRQYPLGGGCGFGVWRCPGTITLRRFVHGVPPGSADLVASGGVSQGADNRGTLVLEECDFSGGDDDGVNQLAPWRHVLAQPAANQLTVEDGPWREGDTVGLWDWPYGHVQERCQAKVTAVLVNQDRSRTLTLDRAVTTVKVGPREGNERAKLMRDGIDRLVDLDAVGSALIRRCRFTASRARPVLIKSRQALFEDCVFHDAHMPGIQAGAEMYWDEGPQTLDLTVRGCTFDNIDCPAVDVGLFESDASYDCRRIRIERNTFRRGGTLTTARPWMKYGYYPQGVGVRVRNAVGVVIRDNVFEDCAGPNIIVQTCRDVEISGNRFSGTHQREIAPPDPAWVGDPGAVIWLDRVTGAKLRDNRLTSPGPWYKRFLGASASCREIVVDEAGRDPGQ
jgi:hypothetical protein